MIVRNCAGGVVFREDKVFILKNDKEQWVLPKGKIRNGLLPTETAISRVEFETGVKANIVSTAGETSYEFFSLSREQPVYNMVTWYIMEAEDDKFKVNKEEGFRDGGFFSVEKAIEMISHNQDKSLVNLSYKKYIDLKEDFDTNRAYA
ncbi:MAG TPA: NUDIX hydrolase [Tissierellales bacterium]|nr:NUDIX hydrolase [Tissierellales bacterium]